MALTKEHYLVIQTKKEDQAMLPHFKKLYVFNNALYHPDTKQKMFVFNCGHCIKGDCSTEHTGHRAKVLLPESSLCHFSGEVTSDNAIGRVVVCFSHFSFEDRMKYLTQGSFPQEVSLLKTKHKKAGTNATTEPKSEKSNIRICGKALNVDRTWVTLCIINPHNFFSTLKGFKNLKQIYAFFSLTSQASYPKMLRESFLNR